MFLLEATQMCTMLSQLPSDVLRAHVFPYLDYTSRMALNQTLPSYDRYVRRISLKDRLSHDIEANLSISKHCLHMEGARGKYKKWCIWRNYCKSILSHRVSTLIQCRVSMRTVLLAKLAEFSDQLATEIIPSMPYLEKIELIQLMHDTKVFIHSLPYLNFVKNNAYCVEDTMAISVP